MISILPLFQKGLQYRELSPKEGGNRWRFETLADITFELDCHHRGSFLFTDHTGRPFARIDGYRWTILKGYAWNGSSPKRWVPVFGWIGTPDPIQTHAATGLHDSLGQAATAAHFPLSRYQVDAAFFDVMALAGFRLAGTYHGAVRHFGPAYAAMNRGPAARSYPVSAIRAATGGA
jgi:hypothetical protein